MLDLMRGANVAAWDPDKSGRDLRSGELRGFQEGGRRYLGELGQ